MERWPSSFFSDWFSQSLIWSINCISISHTVFFYHFLFSMAWFRNFNPHNQCRKWWGHLIGGQHSPYERTDNLTWLTWYPNTDLPAKKQPGARYHFLSVSSLIVSTPLVAITSNPHTQDVLFQNILFWSIVLDSSATSVFLDILENKTITNVDSNNLRCFFITYMQNAPLLIPPLNKTETVDAIGFGLQTQICSYQSWVLETVLLTKWHSQTVVFNFYAFSSICVIWRYFMLWLLFARESVLRMFHSGYFFTIEAEVCSSHTSSGIQLSCTLCSQYILESFVLLTASVLGGWCLTVGYCHYSWNRSFRNTINSAHFG